MNNLFKEKQKELNNILNWINESQMPKKLLNDIINCYVQKSKIIIFGNGGSASQAQHISGEFVGKFNKPRTTYPCLALTSDSSVLTCIANDFGYHKIFTRQLHSFCQMNDLIIGLSTSGSSTNVLDALLFDDKDIFVQNKNTIYVFTGKLTETKKEPYIRYTGESGISINFINGINSYSINGKENKPVLNVVEFPSINTAAIQEATIYLFHGIIQKFDEKMSR